MGYVFLGIALLAGTTKGYCGKKMGTFTVNMQSAVLVNIVRMAVCAALGALIVFLSQDVSLIVPDKRLLLISFVAGISTSVFVVTWLLSVRQSAYMMVDVFLTLGVLVPMTSCFFLFGETVSQRQWVGYAILVIAALIMCSYNNSIKVKLSVKSLIFLVTCGLANGITDFSQKWFVKEFPQLSAAVFNLYTYIFAAVILLVFYLFTLKREKPVFEEGSALKYIYVFVMAVMLMLNSLFKTKAALLLDSASLYPLNQGTALILSSLMAAVFFKERLSVKCILGMLVAFLGLLVMNWSL